MNDKITIDDVRRAGFCARGIYGYAREKGWSRIQFQTFVKTGATEEELRSLGDQGLVDRVIETKRMRNHNGAK